MVKLDWDWSRLGQVEEDWVKKCFFLLYDELKDEPFTAEEAQRILAKKDKNLQNVHKVISPLLKAGLVKKVLKSGKLGYQIVLEGEEEVKEGSKDELLKLLKSAADIIRTAVDYRVLLLFLFYKVISDKWRKVASEYLEEGFESEEAYSIANEEYVKLYDEEKEELLTWDEVARRPETIHEIKRAVARIVELNREDGREAYGEVRDLANRVGLDTLAENEDLRPVLTKVVDLFGGYDFKDVDYDVIGDAYQWILSYFAPTKAKEGETYTPTEVVRLMVRLLDPGGNSRIVDPACGSTSMLVESYKHVAEKVEGPRLKLYGQDRSIDMTAVAKMNALLHGITSDIEVYCGDSLTNPMFLSQADSSVDYLIANPPWNQRGYGEETLAKPELKEIYSRYPPKTTADWAWIQLMLYTARKKTVVVIDQGTLFRGGKEKKIRQEVVDNDLVEAVILLPEKLFYNVTAPGVVIVFNKEKSDERKRKVQFIDASNLYDRHPEVKRLNILKEEHINGIVETHRDFKEETGFSKVVNIEEVKENDYNLNIGLYVIPIVEEESVDVEKEREELMELNKELDDLTKKVDENISEIAEALRHGKSS